MSRVLLDRQWSATLRDVPEIVAVVADAASAQLPPERLLKVELAVEEAVVNVCRHGYGGEAGWLRVRVREDDGEITVDLADRAAEFNPLAQASPDLSGDLTTRAVGGMGIHLIRNVCDRVEYARANQQNVLRLVFEISPSS